MPKKLPKEGLYWQLFFFCQIDVEISQATLIPCNRVILFEIEDAFNFFNFLFTIVCIFALDSKVAMGYYVLIKIQQQKCYGVISKGLVSSDKILLDTHIYFKKRKFWVCIDFGENKMGPLPTIFVLGAKIEPKIKGYSISSKSSVSMGRNPFSRDKGRSKKSWDKLLCPQTSLDKMNLYLPNCT